MKSNVLSRFVAGMLTAAMVISSVSISMPTAIKANELKNTSSYQNNQGELTPNPLIQLPLGAVKADEWLENQLVMMKDGITGRMDEYADYNDKTSAWLGLQKYDDHASWENAPYYVRGLVALAYALGDEGLREEAVEWIAWSIDNQQQSGYFGPAKDDRWWSRMPMLCAIRDFYEAVEAMPEEERTADEEKYYAKVIDFLTKYFRYQSTELKTRPLSAWADARGGDNLEIVYWLYNELYDAENPNDTKWLIDLGDLIYSQTQNWENEYNNTTVRQHVVNTSQGMKTPALYSQRYDDEKYKTALANGIQNMSIDHGRIDELPNSDEAARDNRSTRGSETCGTVEGLLSTEIAMRISGEVWMADRIERLAYNALPAAYTPNYNGHCYYILQNEVMSTTGNHEFDCDHGDSSAYGAPIGYDCCFANNHMGWAKFVQNMWMATNTGGLAVVAYGPNHVKATVADGATAEFKQITNYPFRDQVELDYSGETAEFDLQLRIPEWAVSATVKVNGETQTGVKSGEFYVVDRTWTAGDKVDITFESEIELTTWYNQSTAVQKGALIYSLKIDEDWRNYDENDVRELKVEHTKEQPLQEIYPASAWNYGLVTDENARFEIVENEITEQPFSSTTAPISIIAKGQLLPEWTLDGNIAGPQPFGPVEYDESKIEDITLIPYGSARLRVTHFPTLGDVNPSGNVVRTKYKTFVRNNVTYKEFDNLVVPAASNYNLVVKATGEGQVIINSKYTQNVSGDFTITDLKGKLSDGFVFDAGQYNNIRFTGDIEVSELTVEVVEREIQNIQVISTTRDGGDIRIVTNLDPQETPYRVVYGTASGNYTNSVNGFSTSVASLVGLDADTTYYAQVISTICGKVVKSAEIVVEPSGSSSGLKPNPNATPGSYAGFNTLNYMTGQYGVWTEYDPDNKIEIQASAHANKGNEPTEIVVNAGEKTKAILDVEGSANWVDYVAEAQLTIDAKSSDNGGIVFRTTGVGNDPDAYNGYYVGLGGSGVTVGYADGGWHHIKDYDYTVNEGEKYTIKVVVYGTYFAVYVNDEYICTQNEGLFAKGTVGVRAYKTGMTVHNLSVRPIEVEDLAVFEQQEEEEEPIESTPVEDFEDDFAFDAGWEKYGDTNLIQIANGQLNIGKSTNVKAVYGETTWRNYVYEADVTLSGDGQNAGLLVRSSNEGSGGDNYHGYYFGISVGGYEIGKANGGWTGLGGGEYAIKNDTTYRLKVVAYDEKLLFYIDDAFVTFIEDSEHAVGRIGLRGHNKNFVVDNISVKELDEATIADVNADLKKNMEIKIEAVAAANSFQVKYPRISNATNYRVYYGTTSGIYTDEFVDIYTNGYKGGNIFTHDKVAVSTKGTGTYYVKLIAYSGTVPVAISDEVIVNVTKGNTTGKPGNDDLINNNPKPEEDQNQNPNQNLNQNQNQTQTQVQQLAAPVISSVNSTIQSYGSAVKITIAPVENAKTYTVYRKVSSKVTKIGSTSENVVYDKAPVSGKKASYYAVAETDDTKFTASNNSNIKSITLAKDTSKVTVKNSGKNVKIAFKKVKNTKGYYVFRSTKKNGTYTQLTKKAIKKLSYVDKKAKKGKTYYYKVVSFGKNKTYSAGKISKKIKVKK